MLALATWPSVLAKITLGGYMRSCYSNRCYVAHGPLLLLSL